MKQHEQTSQFFSELEYLLCDMAYEPDSFLCRHINAKQRDEEQFNTCLACVRVVTEHTMGLWKGRFPWLRKIHEDALSDIDDPQNRIPERVVLDAPVPVGSGPGTWRDQLKNLVRDYWAGDNGSVEISYDERRWSSFADDNE
ncbi:hypothetical protein ACHAWO_002462 [Cyclotella atomus]|uniref:DDE Tnp4 domain-containing protein n=1 Tax=Cyclotella atomus TaxID=382360 RepID=A0ABD3NKD5_9STRA